MHCMGVRREAIRGGVQAAAAGLGFLAGHVWGVYRWAGTKSAGRLLAAALPGACGLGGFYTVLVALLFWPSLAGERAGGLRAALAPAAFTLSFAVGVAGTLASLWLVG